jgi:hypothetical protein
MAAPWIAAERGRLARGVTRIAGHFEEVFDAHAKKGGWGARVPRVPLELGPEGGNVRRTVFACYASRHHDRHYRLGCLRAARARHRRGQIREMESAQPVRARTRSDGS